MRSWTEDDGVPELIRRAYADPEATPKRLCAENSAAAEFFTFVGAQRDEFDRREAQLRTQRGQCEAASQMLRDARREIEEARKAIRLDRLVNASVAAGLLAWTSYCLEWSHVPHPAIGCLMLVATWAVFYHYRGRRWLHGDRG